MSLRRGNLGRLSAETGGLQLDLYTELLSWFPLLHDTAAAGLSSLSRTSRSKTISSDFSDSQT
jgi:hypothetical protein